jgi:TatD DNase family protein
MLLRRSVMRLNVVTTAPPVLIDSHCHLNHPRLSQPVDDVIARAFAANVQQLVTISCEFRERQELVALCRRYPKRIFCSVGVHPHCSAGCEETATEITKKLIDAKTDAPAEVVAFGECGLDYFKCPSPADVQKVVFRAHLEAAVTADVPVVVHARDADEDTMAIMSEYTKRGLRGVLHCFNGGPEMAQWAVDSTQLYVSISGIVTFAGRQSPLRRIIRDIVPLDRLLVETDSPFLAPHPHRGKPCEPSYVAHTAGMVAKIKQVDFATLCAATTANTRALFGLPDRYEHAK